MIKNLDSRLKLEKYNVAFTKRSKCWIYLHLSNFEELQLHSADANESLVSLVSGHEIDIIKKIDPHGIQYIAAIMYNDEFIYPKKNEIETERFYKTGLL